VRWARSNVERTGEAENDGAAAQRNRERDAYISIKSQVKGLSGLNERKREDRRMNDRVKSSAWKTQGKQF
jgi:hypothetical protein